MLAASAVATGSLTVGDVVFLKILIDNSYRPLFNMGNIYLSYLETVIEMKDIVEILSTESEVKEKENALPLQVTEGAISFKDVSVSYENKPILKNLSLEIEPSSLLVVTGPSGIGKSTMMNLLIRFFDPESGNITIDG